MMKIVVMSDSHGSYAALRKALQMHEDADLFFHLGDGEHEVHLAAQTFPWFAGKLYYIKGNCDFGHEIDPAHRQLTLTLPFGHRIFAAHGDRFQVKYGTSRMAYEAQKEQADILLYGHTHVRDCRYEDGLYIINPGSLGCPRDGKPPSYAVISVSEKGILANPVNL